MMKVLHINSYYNGSIFYKNLYEMQLKNNLDIDVFVPISKNQDIYNSDLGSYSNKIIAFKNIDRYFYHIKQKKILRIVQKEYNVSSYDVLHAHSLFTNGYIAYKLNKKYGIPYIVAVRNSDVNTFFKLMPHLRPLANKILLKASRVVFISESYYNKVINKYVKKSYKDKIKSKSLIIPNGLNEFWLDNLNTPKINVFNKEKDTLKLLYVGEINKNKNIDITLKVIRKLQENDFRVEYIIIGNITDEKYKFLNEQNNNVKYYKYMNKNNLIKFYRESDIFVMPSKRETFGIVYLESMSQGTPVIYSKGQGFDNQISDGIVGYPIKYDSLEDLYNSIVLILDNYNEISKNSIKKVTEFSWDKIEVKYRSLYKEL